MIAQLDPRYIRTRPAKALVRLLSYALFEGRPVTTKGRWINPAVFTLFRLQKSLPPLKQVKQPIFIVGTGRSGTTILGVVMSMHRDVGYLNEPKALWHAVYPEEDVLGHYSRGCAYYRLDASHATGDVQQAAHRLFGAYLAFTATKRVVDKHPELIFRIPFVRSIFPDAKFIFLVRNGWSTCHSIGEWSARHGVELKGEVHDWWGVNRRKWVLLLDQLVGTDEAFPGLKEVVSTFTKHVDMATIEWVVTMREGLRHLAQQPDYMRLVRYEDLVSDPRTQLQGLAQFCGLPPDETFLSYGEATLAPVPSVPEFDLHPMVQSLFEDTMRELGYS